MKWTRTTALLLLLPSAPAEDVRAVGLRARGHVDPSGRDAAASTDASPRAAAPPVGRRHLAHGEKRRQRHNRERNKREMPAASRDDATSRVAETRGREKEQQEQREKRATPTNIESEATSVTATSAAQADEESGGQSLQELQEFRSTIQSSNKSSNKNENSSSENSSSTSASNKNSSNGRLHVSHVYTYGAPSVVKGPAMSNPNNACIPGLRIYTEDFEVRTCSWWEKLWCTPGGEDVTNVDFASQINVKEGYPHPKMSTLVLRLGEGGKAEYTYRACRDYERKDMYNHQWWPGAHLDTSYMFMNHYLTADYEPRLRYVPEGIRGPALEYVSVASCIGKPSLAAAQACLNGYGSTGGVAVRGWQAFAYMKHARDGGRWFADRDNVYVLRNDRDPGRRRCLVGFQGSDAAGDLLRFVGDDNDAVGYCGRSGVHGGVARELSEITRDAQYAARIVPALETCHEVTCVGHSLGGALCNLFTMCANRGREHLDGADNGQMWDDYQSLIWEMPS